MNLYSTKILKAGFDDSEQGVLDRADFEENHKPAALRAESVSPGAAKSEIVVNYAAFHVLITGNVTWADVRYVENYSSYSIFIFLPDADGIGRTYKALDVTAGETEQEFDLGGEYTAFAVSNGSGGVVEVRINSASNDKIVIEKQGGFSYDNFLHSKFYVRTQGGTSKVTILSSKNN